MRSLPHQRNMGWREASMVLTVMSKVSGQCSMGPTGVRVQSKARVRRAISPVPKMNCCGKLRGTVRARMLSWALTVTNDSYAEGTFGSGDVSRPLMHRCPVSNKDDVFLLLDG